jgi:hypothetical protein
MEFEAVWQDYMQGPAGTYLRGALVATLHNLSWARVARDAAMDMRLSSQKRELLIGQLSERGISYKNEVERLKQNVPIPSLQRSLLIRAAYLSNRTKDRVSKLSEFKRSLTQEELFPA